MHFKNLWHRAILLIFYSLLFLQIPSICMTNLQFITQEQKRTTEDALKTLVQKGFKKGTCVLTSYGPKKYGSKKIEDLRKDDVIITYTQLGELQEARIEKTFTNLVDRLVKITIAGATIFVGANQEFFDGAKWVKAHALTKKSIASYGNKSVGVENVDLQKLDEKKAKATSKPETPEEKKKSGINGLDLK